MPNDQWDHYEPTPEEGVQYIPGGSQYLNVSSGSVIAYPAPPPLQYSSTTSELLQMQINQLNTVPVPGPSTPALSSTQWAQSMGLDYTYIPTEVVESSFTAKKRVKEYDMENEREKFHNKRLAATVGFKEGSQKGDIGVEIECEGVNLVNTIFKYWLCHADGSLRATGEHLPVEYVLKEPLSLEDLKEALHYLVAKLREGGSKVLKSQRTSVHIHINCQKMTIRELYCFLCLYMIFEEILVDWSGPERAGNLFCLRAKDSDYFVNMLESVLKNHNFKQWREEYRYTACNVASIPKFGSLEFRSMQGTIDPGMIHLWASLLMMLKKTASEYDNPQDIVTEFTTIGPLPFFKKVFKDKQYRELLEGIPGLSGKLWDGLRLMRDVAYASDWSPPNKKKPRKNPSKKKPKSKMK